MNWTSQHHEIKRPHFRSFLLEFMFSDRLSDALLAAGHLDAIAKWSVRRLLYHYYRLVGYDVRMAMRFAGYKWTFTTSWAKKYDSDAGWQIIEAYMKANLLRKYGLDEILIAEAFKEALKAPFSEVSASEKLKFIHAAAELLADEASQPGVSGNTPLLGSGPDSDSLDIPDGM